MILEGFRCYFSQLLGTISALTFDYVLCFFFVMHSKVAVADGMAMLGFLNVAILSWNGSLMFWTDGVLLRQHLMMFASFVFGPVSYAVS